MICELHQPKEINQHTGNISVSMWSILSDKIDMYHYTGNIDNVYVDVNIPKKMVKDACIYYNEFKANLDDIILCDELYKGCEFMLLPKSQILKYHYTQTMDIAPSLIKNNIPKILPLRKYNKHELRIFHYYRHTISEKYPRIMKFIEKQYREYFTSKKTLNS